jgi:hypothetical protein
MPIQRLRNPLELREPLFVRKEGTEEHEGHLRRETLLKSDRWRENPRGPKAQKSKRLRPGLNIWEAERSTASSERKSR